MPLYTDPGYSYYSSSVGSMYSPYYSSPLYGSTSSSSSSPYAPYSSTYNRSFSGTYSLPSSSRSTRYTTMVSAYQPKLSTITESPLNRSNFIPLTRIKSPKLSSYSPSLSTAYIPTPRSTRLKTINTADIDVSATSRYGKHHHMEDRKDDGEKSDALENESAAYNNTDSDTNSSVVDPNSPFMPRIDGTDTGHTARSTIKRNRAVVRLSMMRPRSKKTSESDENTRNDVEVNPERNESAAIIAKESPEKFYIQDRVQEQSTQISVTDMIQSQSSETSLSEVVIEVDPVTHAVRRLSIPQGPTFHDICEDISSDKIDDDLNAGELRRRASLIQEQEIEIINELQKSQSGSFQVIHLERNVSQEDCRKSRKSKKSKKLRHKITANVEIINPPLTPVIQQTIEEEYPSTTSPVVMPKFTFNIEEIEEHKVFKLPKKRVKSVKVKKVVEEKPKEAQFTTSLEKDSSFSQPKSTVDKPISNKENSEYSEDFWAQIGNTDINTEIFKFSSPKSLPPDEPISLKKKEEPDEKVATPKPIKKISKSDSTEDFWSQIGTRETLYMNKRKKTVENCKFAIEETMNSGNVDIDSSFKDPSKLINNDKIESKKFVPDKKNDNALTDKSISDQFSNDTNLANSHNNENTIITSIASVLTQDNSFTKEQNLKNLTTIETSGNEVFSAIKSEATFKNELQSPENFDTISSNKIENQKSKASFSTMKLKNKSEASQSPQVPDKSISLIPEQRQQQQSLSPKKLNDKSKLLTDQLKKEKTHDDPLNKTLTSSPKIKNTIKISSKKQSSPKNSTKEEIPQPLETNTKPKAKSSASLLTAASTTTTITTHEENSSSTKIRSGSGAKSPDKRKSVKNIKPTTKKSITKSVSLIEVTSNTINKEIDESKPINKEKGKVKSVNEELQKPSATTTQTFSRKSTKLTTAKSDNKSSEKVRSTEPELVDKKLEKDSKQADGLPTNLNAATSPLSVQTSPSSETQNVTQQPLVTPKAIPDVSVAQVQTTATKTESSSQSQSQSQSIGIVETTNTTDATDCNSTVLGSGSNNLSKFATVSNLAQYLLDVDADLEDYIPSSAEESDSSSDSYSGDGSLSASMKKKNKQLKKKAKEAQQAFDPNKKIKIDTKKKCYVKEEAPRYPLVATPRPLWKREKIVYEESSNSSSEETESESESTTSDEYEDELCPKDAIIRMSTCSNDSGFDGGTTPSSPKKVLETSYTYLQFQKTGRITAPATTIPRFKKYSVEDFNFLAVLGKGSFGKVLLAELRNTDFYYAVKCLKKDVVLEDDDVECTLIERKVLALGTKHPYLCHLFCTFQTESHLFFVMEYLNGGDLMFHIQESGRFPEDRARFYGAEIISGLKFLHKKGIIYRDLKLDNVLLDFDGHVRIADFGMCKLQIYLDKTADSFCGTPDYMAPEIIKGDKYNQNVDWWSFGVLLYEMLIGQSPFSGCDEDELFWSICNEIPWFPVYITHEATSILKGLLEKDYTRRVGSQYSPAGDICDHIFFKDIDWGLLEKRQLPPPFKPQVKHPLDTQYFDRSFTRERVRLTPIDKEILQSMDQEQFQGFSYTNPNATLD
ncbi:probable serine/threonine-protein kinase ndrC isoform X1 [Eupeodes corollae]|uniref:probable serine/threonine-protein kinase ndrC isoform X1 n=1 Tax=Eupeodes corollae TaxID=290404 RepID=UPI002491BECE|nr:probable serine/threonine-protein kinase ndrC isoform X1 [Eupeodes corollae]